VRAAVVELRNVARDGARRVFKRAISIVRTRAHADRHARSSLTNPRNRQARVLLALRTLQGQMSARTPRDRGMFARDRVETSAIMRDSASKSRPCVVARWVR